MSTLDRKRERTDRHANGLGGVRQQLDASEEKIPINEQPAPAAEFIKPLFNWEIP